MFNIVFIGPQASGKGTQARRLLKQGNFFYVEMGSILRELAKKDTPLGREIDRMVNQEGILVPDQVIRQVLGSVLNCVKKNQGIIFDGFPRVISQVKILNELLVRLGRKIDLVIFLKISDAVVYKRLSGRMICEKCGKIYNRSDFSGKISRTCPVCGRRLMKRADDEPEKIRTRLALFRKETLPVVEFYRKQGILFEVDGEKSTHRVAWEITAIIKKNFHDCG